MWDEPVKPDERRFLYAVNLALKLGLTPRDVINDEQIGIPAKRCHWFLTKWSRRRWYDYGTTLDLGWWTPAGKTWAEETLRTVPNEVVQ